MARAALDVAEAKFRSLQSRIAADDAAQNQSSDANEFAGLANRSERLVRYLAAVHARELRSWRLSSLNVLWLRRR